jgi:hypothetical protein
LLDFAAEYMEESEVVVISRLCQVYAAYFSHDLAGSKWIDSGLVLLAA